MEITALESRIFRGEGFAPKWRWSAPSSTGTRRVIDFRLPLWRSGVMKLDKTLLALAHSSAATLFPGSRHTPAALLALFREQHPQVHSPRSLIGMAWLRVGLRPSKSNGTRFWYVPAALPPLEVDQVSSTPRPTRAKRRYTVDLTPLHMQPGDGVWVTVTPDAITIRKATA